MDAEETAQFYARYHAARSRDRQHPLNPEVIFQTLANQAALFRSLRAIDFDKGKTVLDVGGGGGGSLVPFMAVGCPADTLTCVDIRDHSAEIGTRFPGVRFHHGDASALPFKDAEFDLVAAFGIFHQMRERPMAEAVAHEMRRVCRKHILIADWSMTRREDTAVTRHHLERLFDLRVVHVERGALIPPLGRRLSKFAPPLYFLVKAIFPFLVAMRVHVLEV